jgi:hypothetical protein
MPKKTKKAPARKSVKRPIAVTVHPRGARLSKAIEIAANAGAGAMQSMLKRAAEKIPDQIVAPGYGPDRGESWIRPGRYLMQNGSIAIVVEPVTLKFGLQMRQLWHGWKGHLEGHPHGEGLVWGLDGKRSDATPVHEHDLLKRHAKQVKA